MATGFEIVPPDPQQVPVISRNKSHVSPQVAGPDGELLLVRGGSPAISLAHAGVRVNVADGAKVVQVSETTGTLFGVALLPTPPVPLPLPIFPASRSMAQSTDPAKFAA